MSEIVTTLAVILSAITAATGDARWQRREAATKALSAMTPLSLAHAYIAHGNCETANRCRYVSRRWIQANAEWLAARIETEPLPWLWHGCYDRRSYYVKCGCETHANSGPNWPAWRIATRLWVRDQFRAGRSPSAVMAELRRMKLAEAEWKRDRK